VEKYVPKIVNTRHVWSGGAFADNEQHDVSEALALLLGTLIDVDNDTITGCACPIREIMGVSVRQEVRCCECGAVSDKSEQENLISISFPRDEISSLEELLKNHFGEQILKESDDPYVCPATRACPVGCRVTRFRDATRWPPVLVITLKRWSFEEGLLRKLDEEVLFGSILNIDGTTIRYQLRGVVEHHGLAGGGHYTAFVRGSADDWYFCDDRVTPELVSVDAVLLAQAYVLVYEMIREE